MISSSDVAPMLLRTALVVHHTRPLNSLVLKWTAAAGTFLMHACGLFLLCVVLLAFFLKRNCILPVNEPTPIP